MAIEVAESGVPSGDEPSFPGLPMAEKASTDSFLLAAAAAAGTTVAAVRAELEARRAAAELQQPHPTDSPAVGDDAGAEQLSDPADRAGSGSTALESADSIPGAAVSGQEAVRRKNGVPLLYFLLVCSYAVLATLIVLVALRLRPHQLESLPDIVPQQDAQGEIQIPLYPEEARLPPGHELRLGEVQQFGNVEVQPLRVTRGPIEFVHFQGGFRGDDDFGREVTAPVWKLWLRFRNVSPDQTFAPLGSALVFTRGRGKADRRRRGNNFIAPADPDARPQDCVYVFDHVVSGDYDLKDQHVNRGLGPGAELTTYIPSEEDGLQRLEGDLVWRVHFRKGLGPSGWGVTTLVDVRFHSGEVQVQVPPCAERPG